MAIGTLAPKDCALLHPMCHTRFRFGQSLSRLLQQRFETKLLCLSQLLVKVSNRIVI